MRVPDELSALADDGIIDEVIRPLMSGKEAQIYLVVSQGRECVAKVYKEAQNRSFKHRADYTEGRKVRNSRDQRAMAKRSKYGRAQDEASWRSTEVDTIYRLQSAGVRVPAPYHFLDGVLVMELVTDGAGSPAPRLGDVAFEPHEATAIYQSLIQEVVRMLCAGVIHGDLSEFNVLLGSGGPVVIDFPQAIDPSKNQNARTLLLRDVENLHRFHSRFVPGAPKLPYAQEMWALFEQSRLTPDTRLSGRFATARTRVDTAAVMALIGDANRDEDRRRAARGGAPLHRPQPQSAVAEPVARAPGAKARRVEIIVEKVSRAGAPRGRAEPRASLPSNGGHPRAGGQPNRGAQTHGSQGNRGSQMNASQANRGSQMNGAQANRGAQTNRVAPMNASQGNRVQTHGAQANRGAQTNRVAPMNASQGNRGAQTHGSQGNRGSQMNASQANRGSQMNRGSQANRGAGSKER
jgi:RIO kinase 1